MPAKRGTPTVTVEIDGVVDTIVAHSARHGVPYNLIYQRHLKGDTGALLVRPARTFALTVADRFARKYDVDAASGCWIWRGRQYGSFNMGGRVDHAHRAAWTLHRGPIPDGLCVLHNCPSGDNPRCVNPDHLFLGTHRDNALDKVAKGRWGGGAGERHGSRTKPHRVARGRRVRTAKLTEDDVRRIRELRAEGASLSRLGRLFNVHPLTARKVVLGLSWTHVR